MHRYCSGLIRENIPLNAAHSLITLDTPKSLKEPLPGQFYLIEVSKGTDPLLRRPFSLFRKTDNGFQIFYRVRGKGTELLRSLREGTEIEIVGPLGNPYSRLREGCTPLVMAGGIGMASVFSLIESLKGEAVVFYGARNADDLFMIDALKELSRELILCTDDGSLGRPGTVVDALRDFVAESGQRPLQIFGCGPRGMLAGLARLAMERDIPAEVSLEEHMACGVGACLGCVVKMRTTGFPDTDQLYQRVCKEGPVFNVTEVAW